MEKEQAEFADSPMLKFSTYSAGLRQGCFLKVSEPEVHRCGEVDVDLDVIHTRNSQVRVHYLCILFCIFFHG